MLCILVLLSMGFDPFFQQLISFPQRGTNFGTSTVKRSVNFQVLGDYGIGDGGQNMSYEDAILYTPTKYVTQGYDDPSQISGLCPSSNCEWPPFQTLGVCNSCQDISDLLEYGCAEEDGAWMASRSHAMVPDQNFTSLPPKVSSCGWFLNFTSESPLLMTGVSQNTTEALFLRLLNLNVRELNTTYWNRSIHFQSIADTWPIADFIISMLDNKASVYANKKPLVSECTLRWCVKTITAKSEKGVFTEEVQSVWTNDTNISDPIRYNWHSSTDNGPNPSISTNLSFTPPGSKQEFLISSSSNLQIHEVLYSFMPMYFTYHNNTPDSPPQVTQDNLPWGSTYITELDFIDTNRSSLFSFHNVHDYVDTLATVLTNNIRNYPNTSEPVQGYGGVESYILITWAWITLPTFVLLGTYIGLALTVGRSPDRRDGGIWKTSLLASVLHGMDAETRQSFGKAWTMTEILHKAATAKIKMRSSGDGYKLVWA
jgi:hypothetical protein